MTRYTSPDKSKCSEACALRWAGSAKGANNRSRSAGRLASAMGLLAPPVLWSQQAPAALPTVATPSQGATGNIFQQMQGYAYDGAIFLGLILACCAFFVVAKNTVGSYSEVQDGKGTWAQVGVNFGAGALLLVFIVYMMSEAAGVLSQV